MFKNYSDMWYFEKVGVKLFSTNYTNFNIKTITKNLFSPPLKLYLCFFLSNFTFLTKSLNNGKISELTT